jgi:multicomponent Na+:H+ antiporter subunit F
MILTLAIGILTLSIMLVVYRVLRGPSWGDRIMAFDFLSVHIVALIVLVTVKYRLEVLLDAALVLSLLGFLGTVSLARHLLLGRVMK